MSTRSKRSSSGYRCTECGWSTVKWVGRCAECQAWGTMEEVGEHKARTTPARSIADPAKPIAQVDATQATSVPTGVGELDRVLGGGLVPGAVILLAGEPGVGKSTLLLDVAARVAQGTAPRGPRSVLYITGEESAAQVKLRADRVGALADSLYLTSETDLSTALGQVEALSPEVLVVDSVQTLASAEVDGSAGGVTQVREVAASLIAAAKSRGMTVLLVGHVTKEGTIAGPRLLEHLVDVVCQFEGQKHSSIRLLRAVKNRYGPTDDVGCFELVDSGIRSVSDPSGLFVSRTAHPVSGTCLTVTMEGRRPLLAEVQALLDQSSTAQPRRATSGLDGSRVAMLLAVLQRRAGVGLASMDAYVSTVGGVRLSEPAADLATALALASAAQDKPLPQRLVCFGEVGLAGEVRPVPGIEQRIREVARLGFTHAVVPASPQGLSSIPDGFRVREVTSLVEALQIFFPPS
ncbi:DNA repair protein RadA [Kocuria palustris]|jgi:DNA repair protein RadA/Sms|nr:MULTISPECIES: DNA repair protein RadA [Kocuria]MDN5701756.1 DNA repair protein RadA [Micrococcales bacterium]ALB02522.1 DNA repair protein RadA [Kocuria palustris]KUG52735.1 DNA repair protein RadA [Kocuria palustris]MBN6753675.1 DNA repair protein RadA [Kocuria palustris]MBN6758671.1 DNA repair protein RadA [Kocuria palustris]